MVQIVFEGTEQHELDVRVDSPTATAADLGKAIDPGAAGHGLVIDGCPVGPAVPLTAAGLRQGAVVALGGPVGRPDPMTSRRASAAWELVVVGGLDAGRRIPLGPGMTVLGREAGCDVRLRDATL